VSLATGTRLGPYEITGPLGAGGMGEVYRARDTKLGREVAIKILPAALAADRERLARFEREAQSLAELNHPHIAQVYAFESVATPAAADAAPFHALVMELVEGPTLADRLAQGPLPLAEALPLARQLAEALEAAHEQGIVHRDLKPANIKVRDDGTVKVLDFGLAKAMEKASGAGLQASGTGFAHPPTITSPAAMTRAGVVLGTAAYMSPEQARGKPVDRRTDIWAFGVVLYEMLTGRRAFDGETVSDAIAAVLQTETDLTRLPPETPAPVRRLLERTLRKDARQRLRDIGDARLVLDEVIAGAPGVEALAPPESRAPRRWAVATPWTLAALLARRRWSLRPSWPTSPRATTSAGCSTMRQRDVLLRLTPGAFDGNRGPGP
jgi:serine/threonine protein kinase